MKIDPKYFNLFASVVGITGIAAILYFTISYSVNQRTSFIENVGDGSAIYHYPLPAYTGLDTLRASDYRGRFVVLDFWSTWSGPSQGSHEKLWEAIRNTPDRAVVIAAGVKDNQDLTDNYIAETEYPFQFANGTELFHELLPPGVPSQITFNPDGRLIDIRVGFRGADNYDSLAVWIRNWDWGDMSEAGTDSDASTSGVRDHQDIADADFNLGQ
jgi:thiol-disulfide isomerase/thioredoxin